MNILSMHAGCYSLHCPLLCLWIKFVSFFLLNCNRIRERENKMNAIILSKNRNENKMNIARNASNSHKKRIEQQHQEFVSIENAVNHTRWANKNDTNTVCRSNIEQLTRELKKNVTHKLKWNEKQNKHWSNNLCTQYIYDKQQQYEHEQQQHLDVLRDRGKRKCSEISVLFSVSDRFVGLDAHNLWHKVLLCQSIVNKFTVLFPFFSLFSAISLIFSRLMHRLM